MTTPVNSQIEGFRRYMETASDLSEGSRVRYAYEVERFFKLADKGLDQLRPNDILDWNAMLHEGGAARGTVGQKRAALRRFFRYLEEYLEDEHAGRLLRAMNHLKLPPDLVPRRETYSLTKDQAQRIIAAAAQKPGVGGRDRALVHFLWRTGARRAEAGRLLLPKLDLEGRLANVLGKGDKWRTVAFDDRCQEDLARWLEIRATWDISPEVQEVFVSAFGGPLNLNTVGTIVRQAAETAAIPGHVWTHIFRHSRATALLDGGMSIAGAAKFLGHKDPATTMGYYHQIPSELRDEYDRATASEAEYPQA